MQVCPDDYPPSATTEPAFITDDELRRELNRDKFKVKSREAFLFSGSLTQSPNVDQTQSGFQ
jgi:hypothetical protein